MSKYRLSLFCFLLVLAVLFFPIMLGKLSLALPAWMALLFLCFLGYAAFDIRLNFYLTSVNRFHTVNNEIALTIDDSPSDTMTGKLLEVLKKHEVRASFFCIGRNIEAHPEAYQAIRSQGHFAGNHSYSHRNLMPFWRRNRIMEDYTRTTDLLDDNTLRHRAFRPPFGITNPNIAAAIHRLQLRSVGWDIRSLDTKIDQPGRIVARILRKVKPGSILLLHDHRKVTPEVLDRLIPALKERNYNFITVNEILDRHPL